MDCRRALLQVERVTPVIQSCRSVGVHYYFQGCRLLETGVAWCGALGELRASLVVKREGSGFILAGPRTRPTESVAADRYLLSTDGYIAFGDDHPNVFGDDIGGITGGVDQCENRSRAVGKVHHRGVAFLRRDSVAFEVEVLRQSRIERLAGDDFKAALRGGWLRRGNQQRDCREK